MYQCLFVFLGCSAIFGRTATARPQQPNNPYTFVNAPACGEPLGKESYFKRLTVTSNTCVKGFDRTVALNLICSNDTMVANDFKKTLDAYIGWVQDKFYGGRNYEVLKNQTTGDQSLIKQCAYTYGEDLANWDPTTGQSMPEDHGTCAGVILQEPPTYSGKPAPSRKMDLRTLLAILQTIKTLPGADKEPAACGIDVLDKNTGGRLFGTGCFQTVSARYPGGSPDTAGFKCPGTPSGNLPEPDVASLEAAAGIPPV